MKRPLLLASVATAAFVFGANSANAAVVFGFEPGESDLPFTGNGPFDYSTGISTTTGVTQGTQALSITASDNSFGGALSASAVNATAAALLDSATSVTLDLTVPNFTFNYGNIDLHFFQPMNANAQNQSQETKFSPTFATSSGSTVTLTIPLALQSRPSGTSLNLDPTLPFSYQIDFSFGPDVNEDAGQTITFDVDNISTTTVPEPASLAGVGIASAALMSRRRKR